LKVTRRKEEVEPCADSAFNATPDADVEGIVRLESELCRRRLAGELESLSSLSTSDLTGKSIKK
jgi:hypothetical protein